MAWVRFTGDFDFFPYGKSRRVCVAYKAGMVQNVTRACADLAKAKGVAVSMKAPRKNASRSQP